jgi:hypothetical protein
VLYANPQVFVCNSRYEWMLKSSLPRESQWHTKDKIDSYFSDIPIDRETYDILKNKSDVELDMYSSQVKEFAQIEPSFVRNNRFLRKVILDSQEHYQQTLFNARYLNTIQRVPQYDKWESIILSDRFVEISKQIEELKNSNIYSDLITHEFYCERWMEIVTLSPKNFKKFMERSKILLEVVEPLSEYHLSSLALDSKLVGMKARIERIVVNQRKNSFPIFSHFNNQLGILLSCGKSTFDRCFINAEKLYAEDGRIIREIQKHLPEIDIFKILLLREKDVDLLIVNIGAYKHSKLVASFAADKKMKFFLTDSNVFVQAVNNIIRLEDAVNRNRILRPTDAEMVRCMRLSEPQFEAEFDKKLKEKLEDERICQSISDTLSYYHTRTLRQCTGDCATCRRDKCILDS